MAYNGKVASHEVSCHMRNETVISGGKGSYFPNHGFGHISVRVDQMEYSFYADDLDQLVTLANKIQDAVNSMFEDKAIKEAAAHVPESRIVVCENKMGFEA